MIELKILAVCTIHTDELIEAGYDPYNIEDVMDYFWDKGGYEEFEDHSDLVSITLK